MPRVAMPHSPNGCQTRAYLFGPAPLLGPVAGVVHRPRAQRLTGVEVHGVDLLPFDLLQSHRSLGVGERMGWSNQVLTSASPTWGPEEAGCLPPSPPYKLHLTTSSGGRGPWLP